MTKKTRERIYNIPKGKRNSEVNDFMHNGKSWKSNSKEKINIALCILPHFVPKGI